MLKGQSAFFSNLEGKVLVNVTLPLIKFYVIYIFVQNILSKTNMAQPSVAQFFNTRKRAAVEQIHRSNKVHLLNNDSDTLQPKIQKLDLQPTKVIHDDSIDYLKRSKIATKLNFDSEMVSPKVVKKPASRITRKVSSDAKQLNIQQLFQNMHEKKIDEVQEEVREYPTTPKKQQKSTMERINSTKKDDLSLNDIKVKLSRSTRLAELKASIAKINKSAAKLEQLEKQTAKIDAAPVIGASNEAGALKEFKTIELDISR